MARQRKNDNQTFDLLSSFTTYGNYTYRASSKLYLWYQFNSSNLFADSSGNGHDAAYGSASRTVFAITATPFTVSSANAINSLYRKYTAGSDFTQILISTISSLYTQTKISVSFWIKKDIDTTSPNYFGLGAYPDYITMYPAGGGSLSISDEAWTTTAEEATFSGLLDYGRWTHIAIVTNRSAAGKNLIVYKNGRRQTPTSHQASVGTRKDLGSGDSFIGSNTESPAVEMNSFAIWNDLLTDEDVAALYQVYRGCWTIDSGIDSLPEKIVLADSDNATGSYPTIARTGDPDFSGKYSSFYDDTSTINFVTGNQNYPVLLPQNSRWINAGTATPNIVQGLLASGTSLKGISDSHVSFTPGQNISAFDESSYQSDSTYTEILTGTNPSILPGFDQRLNSKTILKFDTSPTADRTVTWSTGSAPNNAGAFQTYILAFLKNDPIYYVPYPNSADTHAITISVTGSAESSGKPALSTSGSNPTSTYGFVFKDRLSASPAILEGGIPDPTTRKKVIIDISGLSTKRDIAMSFVSGVNDLDAAFFAEFVTGSLRSALIKDNRGHTFQNTVINVGTDDTIYVMLRNRGNGKPLLGTSSTAKVDYTTLSYANGGPFVDDDLRVSSSAISGSVFQFGIDPATYASNASAISAGVNPGIAYFNWVDKNWDLIGDLTNASNVDYATSEARLTTSSMLAIVPAAYSEVLNTIDEPAFDYQPLNSAIGLPSDVAGFPLSTKFNPNTSQILDISAGLTAPMLVEKVSLNFSASMSSQIYFEGTIGQALNFTFLLMLERNNTVSGSATSDTESINNHKSPALISTKQTSMPFNRDRRIIWVGRVGKFLSGTAGIDDRQFSSAYPEVYSSCDLWIPIFVGGTQGGITGSFEVTAPCKSISKLPRATPNYPVREDVSMFNLFGISDSDRDLQSISDGRSYISSVVGSRITGTISQTDIFTNEGYDFLKIYEKTTKVSPFVLLPGDKLILAAVNQPYPAVIYVDGGPRTALGENMYKEGKDFNLLQGNSQLTLYGSLLRNNQPVSPESNQPLTSDAIHEDLHYDNPVFDQFDVEPYSTLSGSYVDLVITGSMLATPLGSPFAKDVRQVQSSVASNSATGSLQRFVQLTSDSDVYFDSVLSNFTGSGGEPLLLINSNYGLAEAKNKKAMLRFRRDKFGQFRDMLESAPNASYYLLSKVDESGSKIPINPMTENAVEISFFSRPTNSNIVRHPEKDPTNTHSQNLSNFSTSSLPYFDGVARDRTDNPDDKNAALSLS